MASHNFLGRLIWGVMLTLGVSSAHANAAQLIDFSDAAFIQTAGPTSIPYGHAEFCHRIPSACLRASPFDPAVTLTPALWRQLLFVNDYYNTTIKPMTDTQQYHVPDFWTYPDSGYGDCEDYQLA
jgi:predicted transglutaminase-like cysteine proteinase